MRFVEGPRGGKLLRRLVTQAAVWTLRVIVDPPVFDDFLGLREAGEPVLVQAFLSEPAIRRFEKTGRAVREWVAARNQFAILYPERFNK